MTLTFKVTCEDNCIGLCFFELRDSENQRNQNKICCSSVTRIRETTGHVVLVNNAIQGHASRS